MTRTSARSWRRSFPLRTAGPPPPPPPAAPAPTGGPAFDPADALALADSLQPGTALAFLLVEHHWAAPLFDAIAEAGGPLIGEGFLTSEAGQVVGAEVAALEEASQVIAQAQAGEADALLAAVAAEAEAAEAGGGLEGVQSPSAPAPAPARVPARPCEWGSAPRARAAPSPPRPCPAAPAPTT